MMAVAGSVGVPVDEDKRFGMTEDPLLAQWKVEGDRCVWLPVGGNLEVTVQHEVLARPPPIGVRLDGLPIIDSG
jgi:hypothetical protein